MIIKTARIVCDHDDCRQFHEGDTGESRALVVVKSARTQGWVATDGRQYCPQHIDMADVGVEWWERQRKRELATHLLDDCPNGAAAMSDEQRAREASLRAAKAKVDALPADQRARLQGEFQRAEQEAAAIMRHGRSWDGCHGGLFGSPTECKCASCGPTGRVGVPPVRWGFPDEPPTSPRPCCHTTGPNHHPTCTTKETQQ